LNQPRDLRTQRIRRALHAGHVWATLVLLATGALLEWPELRGRVIGGYGTTIVNAHLWAAVVFLAAPVLALALSYRTLLGDLRHRLTQRGPWPGRWRKTHIGVSLVGGLVLSASGIALWADDYVSRGLWDLSRIGHVAFTVVLAAALPIHLVYERRRIVVRLREMVGLAPATGNGPAHAPLHAPAAPAAPAAARELGGEAGDRERAQR